MKYADMSDTVDKIASNILYRKKARWGIISGKHATSQKSMGNQNVQNLEIKDPGVRYQATYFFMTFQTQLSILILHVYSATGFDKQFFSCCKNLFLMAESF